MFQEIDVKKKRLPPLSVSEDAYTEFEKLAKRENKTASQAIRDAMQEYAAKRGVIVDFNVGAWGGYRDRDPKDEG